MSSDEPIAHNVFEASHHNDTGKDRILKKVSISREDRIKMTTDEEMWTSLEKQGFSRNRPITVTEELMTGNMTIIQEVPDAADGR